MKELSALLKRFWSKVDQRGPDECWPWQGMRNYANYGLIRVGRRHCRAHRVAWVLHYGAVPKGLLVCHRCDNPPCCNPRHLFVGTSGDNTQDAVRKGRVTGGQYKTHCKWGHLKKGQNLYVTSQGWRACKTCNMLKARHRRERQRAQA